MLNKGIMAPNFEVIDIYGNQRALSYYRGKKLMISFYRYASCVFCNLRIAQLIKIYPELHTQNIDFLAFFQSPKEKILEYAGSQKPPFPIIPDPEHTIYKKYEVEESSKRKYFMGLLNINKLQEAQTYHFAKGAKDGDLYLVPADFLIDENQIIQTAYYGKDISDHLPIDRIREFVKNDVNSNKT